MKKPLSMILVLVMVLSLCACAPGGQGGSAAKDGFQVGFGRVDISPQEPVPLMGYGNTDKRISTEQLDPLYATCVAIRDVEGKVLLMISADSCTGTAYDQIERDIEEDTGIPTENITITVTHSHSTPDFGQEKIPSSGAYVVAYSKGLRAAAVAAVEDLKPATMYYTTTKTEKLNFIRHVQLADGTYKGDNFSSGSSAEPVAYAEEIDNTMHLIKFDRGSEKPVLMMNWRAHPTITGGSDKTDISADYVGSVRQYLEQELGCLFAYYQGCAGNVNPRSYIKADDCTRDYTLYGKQLGDYAVAALQGELQQIQPCAIRTKKALVELDINHTTDHLLVQAHQVVAVHNQTGSTAKAKEAGEPYGIRGPMHANTIIKRAGRSTTTDVKINAILFGDQLAITGGGNELFNSIGVNVKEKSPIANTIVLGYTDSQRGYMPTAVSHDYFAYEAVTSVYAIDSAQRVEEGMLKLIDELKNAK